MHLRGGHATVVNTHARVIWWFGSIGILQSQSFIRLLFIRKDYCWSLTLGKSCLYSDATTNGDACSLTVAFATPIARYASKPKMFTHLQVSDLQTQQSASLLFTALIASISLLSTYQYSSEMHFPSQGVFQKKYDRLRIPKSFEWTQGTGRYMFYSNFQLTHYAKNTILFQSFGSSQYKVVSTFSVHYTCLQLALVRNGWNTF